MKKDGHSTIQIGKFDKGRFRYRAETVDQLGWTTVDNTTTEFSWRAMMNNVYYNRTEFAGIKIDDKFVDDGKKNWAIFDSFYGGIHLPVTEWIRLYTLEQRLLAEKGVALRCNFESGYSCFFEGPCKD